MAYFNIKEDKSVLPTISSACPVQITMQVIGGKWKAIMLWKMEQGIVRFGELRKAIPGITQKMLTQQLRELEADGIIWRKVYPVVPPRVEYGLTTYGSSLRFLLNAMADWGFQHLDLRMDSKAEKPVGIKKRMTEFTANN